MFARAVVAVLLTGCSFMQIDRPPRAVRASDRMPGPQCTTNRTMPALDAVLAVVSVAGGIGIATGAIQRTQEDGIKTPLSSDEKVVLSTTAIIEGALFAWSAYYGYQTTGACREMREWIAREPMPQQYPPQQYAPPQNAPPPGAPQ